MKKRAHAKVKTKLHPKNPHNQRYDFTALCSAMPGLKKFVAPNKFGDDSIDFANPEAVKCLNAALLLHFYHIKNWDIPNGYLTPPIPGRADYVHHIAELLSQSNFGRMPKGSNIACFDVGVGTSCIYPIIGHHAYGWRFTGSDINPASLASAQEIINQNPQLKETVDLRLQVNKKHILKGVMKPIEQYDLVICNPPFHSSQEEAEKGSLRKLSNLNATKAKDVRLNFGGQSAELWYPGGEVQFIKQMISEGREFGQMVYWFSALVAKQNHEKPVLNLLKMAHVKDVKVIKMGQGNKTSRIIAWTFLDEVAQKNWHKTRWAKNQHL